MTPRPPVSVALGEAAPDAALSEAPRDADALGPRAETRSDLSAITWDGAAYCVMVGAGQSYLQAFTLALGHPDLLGGLIATVPMVGGAFLQLAAPRLVVRLGSLKRWVILTSVLQALSWLPLAVGAWTGALGAAALFAVVTVYWTVGLGAGPAWTAWIETIIPTALRERFLARRTAICQAATVASFVAAGWVLSVAEPAGTTLQAFGWIFVACCAARLISVGYLTTQSEPVPLPRDVRHVGLLELARRLPSEPGLRALFAAVPAQFALQTAEPFLAPYTLRKLGFGYGSYLCLVAAAFLGRVIVLPLAGRAARRFGAASVLRVGVLGLCPVPLLWAVSDHPAWLTGVQLAAGLAWGAFELGTFLVYFDAVPHRERTSVITAFFFANALAAALGSAVGGQLLSSFGGDLDAYVLLFAASTLLRFATVPLTSRGRPAASGQGVRSEPTWPPAPPDAAAPPR